ncbi:MAG: GNAT family N-acetyltransferase [Pseudomonadota bacterium]
MLEIESEAVDHPDALALIAGSEAELSALYRPEHRYAFSPEELIAANVYFVVARRDEQPIGCGGMAPLEGYGELKRVYVAPEGRRGGIARAIVATLEDAARARALPIMRLETGAASPEAVALYERLGYRRRPPFGSYVENGSSIFMEKAL